ncbi:hypothetical protein GCM10028828_00480 [Corynebacterium tapiri]
MVECGAQEILGLSKNTFQLGWMGTHRGVFSQFAEGIVKGHGFDFYILFSSGVDRLRLRGYSHTSIKT